MKKFNYILFIILTLALVSSCSKFDEYNTNPDIPTTVTPEMLAAQIMKDAYRFWNPNPTDYGTGNLWSKHIVMLETNPNPYQYYYSYYPYGGFGGLQKIPALNSMAEFAKGDVTEYSYQGLALFMKATFAFGMVVDMGDIPYSEAGKAAEGISKPKYDKSVDVFDQILADLKAAEENFAKGKIFGGDIMFGGDPVKWRRLCNAYQLKVLQTISKKATTAQKARFAEIVAAGNLLTAADNYQLVYTTNTNASHPYFDGENRRIITAVSDLVVNTLKANQDRRLFYFAEPAKYKIDGGLTETDFDAYEGAPTQISAEELALNKDAGKYSLVNKRYTLLRNGDPKLEFTYSEQCFILAEAAEEGWISGGIPTAKTYYENGVKAILNYYMTLPSATAANLHGMAINQAYIDGYFTGEAAYKESGSKSDRIKQIITQRWLLDFFQANGFSYKTFLRTGYPEFPLNPATSMNPDDPNVYPKRWKYPTSELTTNPDNYNKAVNEQYGGYDGINKVPWWLQ